MFKFVDAGFEFFQVVDPRFEAIECLDDAGKTLIFLLTADAGLHPTVEGPKREDENPEFHGVSGPGSAGHVVDRASLQGMRRGAGGSGFGSGGVITSAEVGEGSYG